MTEKRADKQSMWSIRVRKHLDNWLLVVVVLLLVVGLLSGWVVYETHLNPGTVTEEETIATWSEEMHLTHQAEVRQPNPVFGQNQTLENHPHYFTSVSPELGGTYTYQYGASGDSELDVQLSTVLQIRSVGEDGEPYWQRTEPLNQTQVDELSPEEPAAVSFEVNVSEKLEEVERIESQLDTRVGSPEIAVVVETHVTGVVNGDQISHVYEDTIAVEPANGLYRVDAGSGIQESHEQTRVIESEATYGPLRSYGPLGLILFALTGLITCLSLRYVGSLAPSDQELAALKQYQQRSEFDEWISRGRIPAETLTGPGVELDSLTDLVDVAIDTNNRVIEDSRTGAFIVIDDDWYFTRPPQESGLTDPRHLLRFNNTEVDGLGAVGPGDGANGSEPASTQSEQADTDQPRSDSIESDRLGERSDEMGQVKRES